TTVKRRCNNTPVLFWKRVVAKTPSLTTSSAHFRNSRLKEAARGCDGWGFRTMPIGVPRQADHRFRVDGDHRFRDDADQLITIVGTVIAMPRNVFHRAR